MKTVYKEIEIIYDEVQDEWAFTLRNRERRVASLRAAKELIDKPVREVKEKSFEPIEAFKINWNGSEIIPGRVTSIADNRYGTQYVWFSTGKTRSKEGGSNIFPSTPANIERIEKIKTLNKEIETLGDKRSALHYELEKLSVE